ncbi:glycosyltransferase [Sellimonas catena]|uniref:Glycosyltransferase EpsE n=1 Tax=Sellimonas catena TaxID=2994035 RepID=A0A9W6CHV7_9FIRM|nr:glycosyltransferase [Sellimonas catena]GLG91697.1 putative glycosyltransferase EpsE [Sellimonas catena]
MMCNKISVIMGIYNCEDTLSEAIDSILAQTYNNWELIMCDDGSSDRTVEIAKKYVKRYSDKIILLQNQKNMGLNYTLNRCLNEAKGEYIARMDGDDRCMNDRFIVELKVLQEEKDIAIVSSDMEYFDEKGVWGCISHPEYPKEKDFIYGTPFCHAPCMVRKEAFDTVQGYTNKKQLLRVEDYHLWIKMYEAGYRGKNIHKILYQMRDDHHAYRRRKLKYRFNEAYVKAMVVRKFNLPIWNYIYVLRPIIVGMLPAIFYNMMHKKHLAICRR